MQWNMIAHTCTQIKDRSGFSCDSITSHHHGFYVDHNKNSPLPWQRKATGCSLCQDVSCGRHTATGLTSRVSRVVYIWKRFVSYFMVKIILYTVLLYVTSRIGRVWSQCDFNTIHNRYVQCIAGWGSHVKTNCQIPIIYSSQDFYPLRTGLVCFELVFIFWVFLFGDDRAVETMQKQMH